MESRPLHRFTLIDGMILMAALAVGLAGVRAGWGYPPAPSALNHILRAPAGPPPGAPVVWLEVLGRLSHQAPAATPVVASLTAALLVVRMRRPDHALNRLIRLPGMLGGWIVLSLTGLIPLVGLTHASLHAIAQEGVISNETLRPLVHLVARPIAPIRVGEIVPVVWIGLAPFRWWRGEPGWIDRAGVVLGSTWAGLLLIGRLAV